jgi:DNA-binding MarR family transcriptional regulator
VEVSTMLVVDAVARTPGAVASVGDVAEVLRVAHSTASRLVERAVGADMVTRERAADDPRRVELRLTAAGADLQTAAVGFRTDRLAAMVGDWPVADIDTLTILLERLSVAFHNDGYTEREGSGPG